MREKILLIGDNSTSKTFSLVSLAIHFPDRRVVIFDPDDGCNKILGELGLEDSLTNLTIVPVRADWKGLLDTYQMVKEQLTPQDWLCLDMLGRFWDLAQLYYSEQVFGQDPLDHLLNLKKQAKTVNFGGFDGLQDWSLIKRLHNEKLMDNAVLWSDFNVMATTSVGQYLPVEKVPKVGVQGLLASKFGIKADGENHNVYRFDTIAVLYRKKEGGYWFGLVKDRGRTVEVDKEFEITGKSFVDVYMEYRGIE